MSKETEHWTREQWTEYLAGSEIAASGPVSFAHIAAYVREQHPAHAIEDYEVAAAITALIRRFAADIGEDGETFDCNLPARIKTVQMGGGNESDFRIELYGCGEKLDRRKVEEVFKSMVPGERRALSDIFNIYRITTPDHQLAIITHTGGCLVGEIITVELAAARRLI